MNYAMITKHAHACKNPLSPPRGTIKQKIMFVASIFASAELSKTVKLLSKHGTTNVNQLPPSRLKFDTKLRKVFPNNLAT